MIVGAGPVGRFHVFEVGLLEIDVHAIDSLPSPGGQPIEPFPDQPIFDIPAVPVCTGQGPTDTQLKRMEPFGTTCHFDQEVTVARKQADGRFFVETFRAHSSSARPSFMAGTEKLSTCGPCIFAVGDSTPTGARES